MSASPDPTTMTLDEASYHITKLMEENAAQYLVIERMRLSMEKIIVRVADDDKRINALAEASLLVVDSIADHNRRIDLLSEGGMMIVEGCRLLSDQIEALERKVS